MVKLAGKLPVVVVLLILMVLSDALTNSSGATIGLGTGALGSDDGTTNYNTALGYEALRFVSSGSNNVGIGKHAGYQSTTPIDAVYIGFEAASAVTTQGGYSVALGSKAARNCTDMDEAVIIGWSAASQASDASNCTFVGTQAGLYNGGSSNVGIGKEALYGVNFNAISYGNTAVGLSAMKNAKNGAIGNTGLGAFTLDSVDGGDYNTAVGYDSGDSITTGSNNTVIGNGADASSATVSNEITLGNTSVDKFRIPGINFTVKDTVATEDYVLTVDANGEAGWEAAGGGGATDIDGLSDGVTNSLGVTVGLGTDALANDDGTANQNTALGYQSLKAMTSGNNNVGIGYRAGTAVTTGPESVIIGHNAAASSGTGIRNNVIIGHNAGLSTSSDYSVYIGDLSGNSGSGNSNVAVGRYTMYFGGTGTKNVAIGDTSGFSITDGSYNITVGADAGRSITTGNDQTVIGYTAGYSMTTGQRNTVIGKEAGYNITTTSDVVAIGYGAGRKSAGDSVWVGTNAGGETTGTVSNSSSVGIGYDALADATSYGNVAVGANAGKYITTGQNNTFIGRTAGASGYNMTTGSNNTVIGFGSDGSTQTISNEITLGNSSISTLRCQVQTISALSDRRDKKDIEELPLGIDFINTLKPVKFTWNMRDGAKVGQQEAGFIAQDLDEAQIDADAEDYLSLVLKNNPEKLEASYGKLVPVLVKAVQELSAEITTLKKEIENGK
jgi:hypothetical protein